VGLVTSGAVQHILQRKLLCLPTREFIEWLHSPAWESQLPLAVLPTHGGLPRAGCTTSQLSTGLCRTAARNRQEDLAKLPAVTNSLPDSPSAPWQPTTPDSWAYDSRWTRLKAGNIKAQPLYPSVARHRWPVPLQSTLYDTITLWIWPTTLLQQVNAARRAAADTLSQARVMAELNRHHQRHKGDVVNFNSSSSHQCRPGSCAQCQRQGACATPKDTYMPCKGSHKSFPWVCRQAWPASLAGHWAPVPVSDGLLGGTVPAGLAAMQGPMVAKDEGAAGCRLMATNIVDDERSAVCLGP